LSQVRALCESAGGTAHIERAAGGGARVTMLLARCDRETSAPVVTPMPALPLIGCVMLVEDNDEVARATRSLLESMGCQVLRAADARQALETIYAHMTPIDLVVSAIEMPGDMDGIALALRLRKRLPPIPVVLMTGYAARLEEAQGQAFDVLAKPCTPHALAQAISNAFARRGVPPQSVVRP
jgi:CheY-like chemotaxis protein